MSTKTLLLVVALLAANAGAWLWALVLLHAHPVLIGPAVLAYTFGLRHAVDADHIAAIDNVTRKLLQQGRPPQAAATWFSLGHATVVFALTLAIAGASTALSGRLSAWAGPGAVLGTLVSAGFLFAIAGANVVVLISVWRALRGASGSHGHFHVDLDALLQRRGFLGRLFRGLFALVTRSWHMYLVGFLFGLGFDTATEIGLLGLSAKGAAGGLSLWSILLLPTLFTAGMALVDTADGLMMAGAYQWAADQPLRKLRYNLAVTLASVIVAVLVGGIEVAGLAADRLKPGGGALAAVAALNDHLGLLGVIVIGVFAVTWAASAALFSD